MRDALPTLWTTLSGLQVKLVNGGPHNSRPSPRSYEYVYLGNRSSWL